MSALIMCLSPLVAAAFCALFAWCGDYPLALWCLLLGPAGMLAAPYLEEAE
jgi:hypothetical protein